MELSLEELWKNLEGIVKQSGISPIGGIITSIFLLIITAIIFFRNDNVKYKIIVFVLLFISIIITLVLVSFNEQNIVANVAEEPSTEQRVNSSSNTVHISKKTIFISTPKINPTLQTEIAQKLNAKLSTSPDYDIVFMYSKEALVCHTPNLCSYEWGTFVQVFINGKFVFEINCEELQPIQNMPKSYIINALNQQIVSIIGKYKKEILSKLTKVIR